MAARAFLQPADQRGRACHPQPGGRFDRFRGRRQAVAVERLATARAGWDLERASIRRPGNEITHLETEKGPVPAGETGYPQQHGDVRIHHRLHAGGQAAQPRMAQAGQLERGCVPVGHHQETPAPGHLGRAARPQRVPSQQPGRVGEAGQLPL